MTAQQKKPQPIPFPKSFIAAVLKVIGVLLAVVSKLFAMLQSVVSYIRVRFTEFGSQSDDIFIATYPRSGTTWMQMILYQLTSDGKMEFQHITEVSPYFERAIIKNRPLDQLPTPRILKTHLRRKWLPKGRRIKYIYVARNGRDVAVSYYHFYKANMGFEGEFEEFFDKFLQGKVAFGSWFNHVADWWPRREDSNVLFLRYEDMKRDLAGAIDRIITFCGFDIDPARMPEILDRCSFDFMKQYENKFDHASEFLWEEGFTSAPFIRKGRVGDGAEWLKNGQNEAFDASMQKFTQKMGPEFSLLASKQ